MYFKVYMLLTLIVNYKDMSIFYCIMPNTVLLTHIHYIIVLYFTE